MGLEVGVGLGEVVVAKETPVCAQWRGVGRGEHKVLGAVYEGAFAGGIAAPQDKDKVLTVLGQFMHDTVGKHFPAYSAVRFGCMRAHREAGV